MIKFFYVAVLVLFGWSRLAGADLYDVAGIPIAAEDTSAQAARAIAIQNGETVAFQSLMDKMLTLEHKDTLVLPAEADIIVMVQNVSLADEKYTATKYMADLSVRFNPQKIQAFLKAQHLPFLTEESPVSVVVPVWNDGQRQIVLEEDNPVYSYLKGAENPTDIRIPAGDLEDMAWAQTLIDEGDESVADSLCAKYGASQVMILKMAVDEVGQEYALIRFVPDTGAPEQSIPSVLLSKSVDGRPDIGEMWTEILNRKEQIWRSVKTEDLNRPDLFWIRVPIRRLADWVQIRKKLEKAFGEVQIYGFRPNVVLAGIRYKGPAGALQREMNRIGFDLTADMSVDVWVLSERKQNEATAF